MVTSSDDMSRVIRSHDQARATYDKISRWYDLIEGVWERKLQNIGLNNLAVKKGESILEIGPGTGHVFANITKRVGDFGIAIGNDISLNMLKITRKRIIAKGNPPPPGLVCGDATYLPLKNDSVDGIYMSFVLELFDNPEIPLVLGECLRVLKNGGRISVVSLSKSGGRSIMRDIYEWGHRNFPRILDCRPIFLDRLLKDAGFAVEKNMISSIMRLPVEIVLVRKMVSI
jgi:ubiquinone/menaquinone biosynthesis C-methylase UbiE